MNSSLTRKRLLNSACRIIAEESLSSLSIDRVSAGAGLSRRTFFLHFASKDQLLTEVLESLRPAQAETFRELTEGLGAGLTAEQRILAVVKNIVTTVTDPAWKGSAFLRVSAEFGELPGHPVHAVASLAHRDMELWFEGELRRGGAYAQPEVVARQIAVLISGVLMMQLIHRNAGYGDAALAMLPHVLAAGRATALSPAQ